MSPNTLHILLNAPYICIVLYAAPEGVRGWYGEGVSVHQISIWLEAVSVGEALVSY